MTKTIKTAVNAGALTVQHVGREIEINLATIRTSGRLTSISYSKYGKGDATIALYITLPSGGTAQPSFTPFDVITFVDEIEEETTEEETDGE